MNESQLALVLGTITSLLFTYFPVLKSWYAGKEPAVKAQIMALVILIVGAGVAGLSCAGVIDTVVCSKDSLLSFFTGTVVNSVLALGTNQATYLLTDAIQSKG